MQRILAIRSGAIGDIILTLPALGAVRQAFPQAVIHLMGNPSRLVFARHAAYVDALLDMEHWEIYRLFSQGARVSERLTAYLGSCEMILAYVPLSDDTLAKRLRTFCAGQVIVWSPHPPPDVHASDHLLRPVAPLLSSPYNPCPHIALDPEAVTAAEQFWRQANLPERGVIAVHPGSGGTHKLWPLAGWRQVLTWVARHHLPCVIISGPAEGDRVAELLQDVPLYPWVYAAQLPLPHLAALLARCQVVVGHDSGITHLAAAVGTTPLALFGPTDPLVWGPRSRRSCVLWPQPPAPLTLETLPAARVIEVLTTLYDGTFPFVPSGVDCTILRLPAR